MQAAGLPGFIRDNWLSDIRYEVKVHGKYANMPDKSPDIPFGSKTEPPDIIYTDVSKKFVEFLEGQDTVGLQDWLLDSRSKLRKYYIEVKTTTRNCDEVFHMSKGQYTRVSSCTNSCSSLGLTICVDAGNA